MKKLYHVLSIIIIALILSCHFSFLEASLSVSAEEKKFIVYDGAYTWNEAAELCRQQGGHLAYIKNDEDYQAVLSAVEQKNKTLSKPLRFLWLGASTKTENGKIMTSWNDTTPADYIDKNHLWFAGEPSGIDHNSEPEFYIMLWFVENRQTHVFEWSFNDGSDAPYEIKKEADECGFICEIDGEEHKDDISVLNWKKAYAEWIRANHTAGCEYALVHLDGDFIPELVQKKGNKWIFVTFNGKECIVSPEIPMYSGLIVYTYQGVALSFGDGNVNPGGILILENGTFQKHETVNRSSIIDEPEMQGLPEYEIDGKSVTFEEFTCFWDSTIPVGTESIDDYYFEYMSYNEILGCLGEPPSGDGSGGSEDWCEGYERLLTGYGLTEDMAWDLYDVDEDGIPELFISTGTYHAAGVEIFSYNPMTHAAEMYAMNGMQFVTQDDTLEDWCSVTVLPEEHLIKEDITYSGHETIDFIRLKDGEVGGETPNAFQNECYPAKVVAGFGKEYKDEEILYYIEQDFEMKEVSKAEFDSAYQKYSQLSSVVVGRRYPFDDFSALYVYANSTDREPISTTEPAVTTSTAATATTAVTSASETETTTLQTTISTAASTAASNAGTATTTVRSGGSSQPGKDPFKIAVVLCIGGIPLGILIAFIIQKLKKQL